MPRASTWTVEEREKLIDLIMKNPGLWQQKLAGYMRADKKLELWQQIAEQLGKTG